VAQLEREVINTHAPLLESEALTALHTGQWDDDPALRLVIADALRAEAYAGTKAWVAYWPQASILYQSPFEAKYWENTFVPRASIPFFTLATAVNSLVPTVMGGLFYENPPFLIEKRPKTSENAAKAIAAIMGYQLEDEEIEFRRETELGVRNAILFGTGVWKWGWEIFTRERKVYEQKSSSLKIPNPLAGQPEQADNFEVHPEDDIEEVIKEEYIDRPFFEHIINLREILVDPGLRIPDIRKAKYVVHRLFLTFKELDRLRDRPGYTIPSQEELISLFFPPKEQVEAAPGELAARNPLWDLRAQPRYEDTSEDPFNQPLEVLERWDADTVIVVLQKKVVICNDKNPYGKIPFLSVGWWDIPEAFWGMGLAKTIGSEQRLQQGITNTWLDNASLNLNGVYVRTLGKGQQSQSIRILPGKVYNVELDANGRGDLKPLERTNAVPEAGEHISMSQARVELVSGANEVTAQGVAGGAAHSNLGRTAAGANLIGAGAASRPQDFVEKFVAQVFIPFLYEVAEMNKALLPKETIHHILDEELEEAYFKEGGTVVDLLNARIVFSTLAGAKMQARRQMAQAMPLLIQLLTNKQTTDQLGIQKKKVNVAQILEDFIEVSGWKTRADWIQDMTPEDEKRYQMNSPAAQQQAKNQGAAKMQQQQHQNKLDLVDQENLARGGREVLRHVLEAGETPEAQFGAPASGPGFGGSF
jgi:hypothetical protein